MNHFPPFIYTYLSSYHPSVWTNLKTPDASQLIGAWTLGIFGITFSDQRPVVFPFGQQGTGLLMYSSCGLMSAILSCQDQASFAVADLEKAYQSSVEDKAKAFDRYLSYGGRWEINWEISCPNELPSFQVIHHLQWSLTPDLEGTMNRRVGTLWRHPETNTLYLYLHYERTARSGVKRTYHLVWQKNKEAD